MKRSGSRWLSGLVLLLCACRGRKDPPEHAGYCGDGVVEGEEACDDGAANGEDAACTSACELARCGDGLLWAGVEACDDGAAGGDGAACTSTCEIARCGDGLVLSSQEACDDGAANSDGAACTSNCELARCGDGLLWEGVEACDDGNDDNEDGCNESCAVFLRIDLADADLKLLGESANDKAGISVSSAGDVNGDGFGDLLIGANGDGSAGNNAGAVYLVYAPLSGTLDLGNADAKLIGVNPGDMAGVSVSGAGDVDGDGLDDLLVGTVSGLAYLVRGPVYGARSLSEADATLEGEPGDYVGMSVSGAGDVDGDGFDDLLVGAKYDDAGGNQAGAAYLVYGPRSGVTPVTAADATITGENDDDNAGSSVSGAGDVDGDGFDDILIGAIGNKEGGTFAGAAYLVRGPVYGAHSLSDADTKLMGDNTDGAGNSVSGAGDVDGDGKDDILIGASYDSTAASTAGAAYLIYAPTAGTSRLEDADASFLGESELDKAGTSVSGAGDVDADGFADLLIGSSYNSEGGSYAGAVYLIYGPAVGTLALADATVKLVGESTNFAGESVSDAGDIDGDGKGDIFVGAFGSDDAGLYSGSASVLLGAQISALWP